MSLTIGRYWNQLRGAALRAALGSGRKCVVGVAASGRGAHMRLLPDTGSQGRVSRLEDSCLQLAELLECQRLRELLEEYVVEVPPPADSAADAGQFLDWLETRAGLSDEQRDLVNCQRCRQAVEFVALRKRLADLRFEGLRAMGNAALDNRAAAIGRPGRVTAHLNPAHVWATFESSAFRREAEAAPCAVLFYLDRGETRTLAVDAETEELLRSLEQCGPQRSSDLAWWREDGDIEEVERILRELCDLGVIALV